MTMQYNDLQLKESFLKINDDLEEYGDNISLRMSLTTLFNLREATKTKECSNEINVEKFMKFWNSYDLKTGEKVCILTAGTKDSKYNALTSILNIGGYDKFDRELAENLLNDILSSKFKFGEDYRSKVLSSPNFISGYLLAANSFDEKDLAERLIGAVKSELSQERQVRLFKGLNEFSLNVRNEIKEAEKEGLATSIYFDPLLTMQSLYRSMRYKGLDNEEYKKYAEDTWPELLEGKTTIDPVNEKGQSGNLDIDPSWGVMCGLGPILGKGH